MSVVFRQRAFSLVEVAVALGVIAFALIAILGMLPVTIASNQSSVEETRATALLTLIHADLLNSSPTANGGKSLQFGFQLPYEGSGASRSFAAVLPNHIGPGYTSGLDDAERPVPLESSSPPRFQASVIYTKIPVAGSLEPMEARLVVNWPGRTDVSSPVDLTTATVGGFVEAFVTFPAP